MPSPERLADDDAGGLFRPGLAVRGRLAAREEPLWTVAYLTAFFERIGQPDVAATIHGCISIADPGHRRLAVDLPAVADRLRGALGEAAFERCAAAGAAMDSAGTVRYARAEIERARRGLSERGQHE